MARCRREIAEIEAQIRNGNPQLEGLALALSDWSAELRLLAAETQKSRGGKPPAATAHPISGPQPLIE